MSKRCCKFERNPRDFYPTPVDAVIPLLPHLKPGTVFCEPCAGDGALMNALRACGHYLTLSCDIEPQAPHIQKFDAFGLQPSMAEIFDFIITNPPWSRDILHPMITHFRQIAPTWLLFDSDWMHTKQAAPYLRFCHKIVSVGRVSWMQNGKGGMDNCAWYFFKEMPGTRRFYPRVTLQPKREAA